jgi:O-acetyl-ADP-ribose deacetylase (regulator of RNase III)
MDDEFRRTFSGVTIECIQGDITNQRGVDVVVNAANAQLMPGGGVAGAIHRAAGPELAEACRALAPIKPGQAVITKAYDLPNKFIVHCLGPVYGSDRPSDELLAACYRNALRLADKEHRTSIAFPAISTGVFGYPIDEAASVSLAAIQTTAPALESIELVRLVLFSDSDLEVFWRTLATMNARS